MHQQPLSLKNIQMLVMYDCLLTENPLKKQEIQYQLDDSIANTYRHKKFNEACMTLKLSCLNKVSVYDFKSSVVMQLCWSGIYLYWYRPGALPKYDNRSLSSSLRNSTIWMLCAD